MTRIKQLENDVKRAAYDYLDVQHIMYLRLNSGSYFLSSGKGKFYRVEGCKKGTADILILTHTGCNILGKGISNDGSKFQITTGTIPRPIFIEFKSLIGKQTKEQKDFEQSVKELGYEYYIVRKIEDLIEVM